MRPAWEPGRQRTLSGALPLSYARWAAGLEPATSGSKKEPLPAPQADSVLNVRDNCRGIVGGLRGHGSNADLLVQGQAWCQFHHLAMVWTGGLEPPPPGSRSRCAPVAPRPGVLFGEHGRRGHGHVRHLWLVGTDGRVRTDTGGGLSAVPLPGLGYVSVMVVVVDRAGVEPATFSLQGSCATCCATGPWWSRGRGSNPPGKGYGPSLISRSPASIWGDRPDSNRLPPGPHPGVSTTSTSATVDEEGVEPPASSV
jgi:hypothetical protein